MPNPDLPGGIMGKILRVDLTSGSMTDEELTPEMARMQELDALLALAGKGGNVVLLPNLADLFARRRDPKEGA